MVVYMPLAAELADLLSHTVLWPRQARLFELFAAA
jgi:hypothetical protein